MPAISDITLDEVRRTAANAGEVLYTKAHMCACLTVALAEIDRVQNALDEYVQQQPI